MESGHLGTPYFAGGVSGVTSLWSIVPSRCERIASALTSWRLLVDLNSLDFGAYSPCSMVPSLWVLIASALTASRLAELCTGRSTQPISPPTKTLSAWAMDHPPAAASARMRAVLRTDMMKLLDVAAIAVLFGTGRMQPVHHGSYCRKAAPTAC